MKFMDIQEYDDYVQKTNYFELPDDTPTRVKIIGVTGSNIDTLSQEFNIDIVESSGKLVISGLKRDVDDGLSVLYELKNVIEQDSSIVMDQKDIISAINLKKHGELNLFSDFYSGKAIYKTLSGEKFYPKNQHQSDYMDSLRYNELTIALGSAGTAKTLFGVIASLNALKHGEVERIVITRPAVEAGENLGFLPGDLKEKLSPYLQPIYDYVERLTSKQRLEQMLYDGSLLVVPLAFMRGRTFDNSFILLDEAQNATLDQIKMLTTRVGFNSKIVITGDPTQVDLKPVSRSGLKEATELLEDIQGIGVVKFTTQDVLRSPLASKLVKAFDGRD